MRFFNVMLRMSKVVIMGLFWIILCFLVCVSAFSTSHIAADCTELTFFVKDSVLANIFVVVAVILVLAALKRMKYISDLLERFEQDEMFFLKCRRSLLVILFAISCIWVLTTQYEARSDQLNIQYAAYTLHFQDDSMFQETGYLARYHNQFGFFWLSYLLSFLFGNYNYVCFQLLNAAALTVSYWKLSELGGRLGLRRAGQLAVILLGILFFPLIMYCSFVYGSILGFMFSLIAIDKELSFFETLKWNQAVWSAAAIALAVLMKTNYLIFLIGMILIALIEAMCRKQRRVLMLPGLILLFYLVQSYGVIAASERITGQPLDEGASSWSYIAMGLQDTAGSAGWWNGYNDYSYIESAYDTSIQAEAAKENIRESLRGFWADKSGALQFFTEKIASQWNNPTFQCFWIVQVCSSGIEKSSWVWHFTSLAGAYQSTFYLNLLQFVILAGALIYGIAFWKRPMEPGNVILAAVFIGGFVFHLFWEAKAQYTILYFVLLFPYMVMGYEKVTDGIWGMYQQSCSQRIEGEKTHRLSGLKMNAQAAVMTLLFVTVFAGFGVLHTAGKISYLTADADKYSAYRREADNRPALSEGSYQFYTASGQLLALTDVSEDGTGGVALLDTAGTDRSEIQTANYRGNTWLHMAAYDLYLTAEETYEGEEGNVSVLSFRNGDNQMWMVRHADDGGLFIIGGAGRALTYDEKEGRVYLTEFTGAAEQRWYVNE